LAKQPRLPMSPIVRGFDYERLVLQVAERVRSAADNIRQMVRRSLEDLIDIGS
jgi:hypothetical protein